MLSIGFRTVISPALQRQLRPQARAAVAAYILPRPQPLAANFHHAAERAANDTPKWRPASVLDDWVKKEARPISLRQLMVYGRTLTEPRLLSSANYVRTELPTRIAHRLRDIQQLPYVVVSNPHINTVYELYYEAFETFRKVKEIKNLEQNDDFCKTISKMLAAHLTVIPKLAMGILESSELMEAAALDKFSNNILRSRISRRVIAEQHLSLTETFHAPWYSPGTKLPDTEIVGEVLSKCVAADVVTHCADEVRGLARHAHGPDVALPELKLHGHLKATFPYILSHIEYIISELLRNSMHSLIEKQQRSMNHDKPPPPIEVTICEAQHHVIIRVSDQGGGIPSDMMPYLWSFSKGPHSQQLLANLGQVPRMSATLKDLVLGAHNDNSKGNAGSHGTAHRSSLSSLATRPPNLRLGMGLPLSRIYAEYWAGKLNLHSLEGYGVDAFLQISRLGNKNEQLTTRASMDAL